VISERVGVDLARLSPGCGPTPAAATAASPMWPRPRSTGPSTRSPGPRRRGLPPPDPAPSRRPPPVGANSPGRHSPGRSPARSSQPGRCARYPRAGWRVSAQARTGHGLGGRHEPEPDPGAQQLLGAAPDAALDGTSRKLIVVNGGQPPGRPGQLALHPVADSSDDGDVRSDYGTLAHRVPSDAEIPRGERAHGPDRPAVLPVNGIGRVLLKERGGPPFLHDRRPGHDGCCGGARAPWPTG
jgi:hypothetical protein